MACWRNEREIRGLAHDFFENYDLVLKSLQDLPKDESGIRLSKGVKRDINDIANGFEA